MAESIRSLTIKLGYEVDTTGADIFKSRFDKMLSGLKLGKVNLSAFEKNFNKNFKASTSRMASVAKKSMLLVAGAIAAGVAAATKVFKGFAKIETARESLKFRTGEDEYKGITDSLEKTREATGSLVSELDVLNAVNIAGDKIGDFDFLTRNMGTMIKLSKILGKDLSDTSRVFATFVQSGSNLDELAQFGFISPKQLEALKKSKTDLTALSQDARKALLETQIAERSPEIEKSFGRVSTGSQATLDRAGTAVESAVTAAGEKLAPAVNNVVEVLGNSADRIKKQIESGGGFFDIVGAAFGSSDTAPVNAAGGDKGSSNQDNSTTTNTITIVGTNKDPAAIAREVEAITAKKIIQSSARREIPQSLNTTIQPAK